MNRLVWSLLFLFACLPCWAQNQLAEDEVREFVQELVDEHGFDESKISSVLDEAAFNEEIIESMSRPAEATPWRSYRRIFLQDERRDQGIEFLKEHASDLERAEKTFGVPRHVIVSILGVETYYGRIMGSYPVIDALVTLGFGYPRRGEFFQSQLVQFLLLACEERIKPFDEEDDCKRESASVTLPPETEIRSLTGSYAGAMGYGQFIPSSYRAYAIDFNGDGSRDIWTNVSDAIGSIGNYLRVHGWDPSGPVMVEVHIDESNPELTALANQTLKPEQTIRQWRRLGVKIDTADRSTPATLLKYDGEEGDQWFLGFHNFYVITRYNISRLYARVVWELAADIQAGS